MHNLAQVIEEVISENPEAWSDYSSGRDGAENFLVGQAMQETGGGVDPTVIIQGLRERRDRSGS